MQKIDALPVQTIAQATNPISQLNPLKTNAIELKDIHVPEQISNYPVAYGWWLLATLVILITIFSIIKIKKSILFNQVKKQALAQLKSSPEMTTSDTIALLKWAAMHYFSRTEIAKLFGDSLQSFLALKLPLKHQKNFTNLSEQAFLNQYQAQLNASKDTSDLAKAGKDLSQAATLWLTHALPPKSQKTLNNGTKTRKNENMGANT